MGLTGKLMPGTGSYEIREIAPIRVNGDFITNSGAAGQTDWVDSNSDGLADDWLNPTGAGVASIVTGNGFIGNAQRITHVTGTNTYLQYNNSESLKTGDYVKVTFRYRVGHAVWRLYSRYTSDAFINPIPVNTGDAVIVSYVVRLTADDNIDLNFYCHSAEADSWIEIDEVSLVQIPEGYPITDKRTKYLECISAGTVSFLSNQAYGEWEFDFKKAAVGNTELRIYFITNTNRGGYGFAEAYMFYITNGESLSLYRSVTNDQKWITVAGYIESGVWYRIKITRTLDGEFTCYIRGGGFGNDDWTLIDPTGGAGTNPVTDNVHKISNYFNMDLDGSAGTGDTMTNFVMRKAVQQ